MRILTTIVLQHTLKLSGSAGGPNPEQVNPSGEGVLDPRIYGIPNIQSNGLVNHNFKNKYHFNPVTPRNKLPVRNVQNNKPDFQENVPNNFWNDANSYAQNPFLNGNINLFSQ